MPILTDREKSHHKNQLPAYCYCAKCGGKVKQNPRTIDIHRARYPLRSVSPGGRDAPENPHEQIENQPLGQGAHSPAGQGRFPPLPPSPGRESTRSNSRAEVVELEHVFGGSSRLPSPLDAGTSLAQPGRAERSRRPSIEHNDDELVAAAEEHNDYPFNRLLDDMHQQRFPVFGCSDDWELGIDGREGFDPNNEQYDEDFGLPDNDGHPPDLVLPQFQLQLDEDPAPEPEDDPDENDNPATERAAFHEPGLIRNAYIDAVIQKTLYGATHRALKHQLKAARRTVSAHPDITAEDIAKMAQSIGTVERRLGVSADDIITTFTLCPSCKRRYSPDHISQMDSDQCLNEGCEGILFTTRRLASGSQRRVSNLTYPYASPIAWLRHVFSLPGMAELMQTWRTGDDDHDEFTAPISSDEWLHGLDPDKPIGDIPEGWGWRSTLAGLQRQQDPLTQDIVDEIPHEGPIRFVSLPFGISFSLNTDW